MKHDETPPPVPGLVRAIIHRKRVSADKHAAKADELRRQADEMEAEVGAP